ncbi:MAG TPA: hypothetical protein VIY48_17675 [Candidatus Paceibacterota bacterium]
MRDFSDDEKAQRRAQALEMRRAGQDVEYISRKLNYPSVYACKMDLAKAFSEVLKTPKEEAKALDLLRLDRMILSLWPDARDGMVTAIDRVIKLIDMRAKLIGTYAPTQVEQITLDAIEQEIRKLEQENSTAARKAINKSRKTHGESPA